MTLLPLQRFVLSHARCAVLPALEEAGWRFGSESIATADGTLTGQMRVWCNGCRAELAVTVQPEQMANVFDLLGVPACR
jgi:hypothetical protein